MPGWTRKRRPSVFCGLSGSLWIHRLARPQCTRPPSTREQVHITIFLAGTPRGKGAGRAAVTAGHARIFTDERTRKYEAQLRYAAQQQMAGRPPTELPCSVAIQVCLAIPTGFSKKKRAAAIYREIFPTVKPDCNNFSKALDALNGVVWLDDKQIVREFVEKVYSEQPGLHVTVETITGI